MSFLANLLGKDPEQMKKNRENKMARTKAKKDKRKTRRSSKKTKTGAKAGKKFRSKNVESSNIEEK